MVNLCNTHIRLPANPRRDSSDADVETEIATTTTTTMTTTTTARTTTARTTAAGRAGRAAAGGWMDRARLIGVPYMLSAGERISVGLVREGGTRLVVESKVVGTRENQGGKEEQEGKEL
jgi:hypothetical protein